MKLYGLVLSLSFDLKLLWSFQYKRKFDPLVGTAVVGTSGIKVCVVVVSVNFSTNDSIFSASLSWSLKSWYFLWSFTIPLHLWKWTPNSVCFVGKFRLHEFKTNRTCKICTRVEWDWLSKIDSFIFEIFFYHYGLISKVHIFWEGHKILRNLHRRFVLCSNSQIYGGDFAKHFRLLRIYELY